MTYLQDYKRVIPQTIIWYIDSALLTYTHMDLNTQQCSGELTCNNWITLIKTEEPG